MMNSLIYIFIAVVFFSACGKKSQNTKEATRKKIEIYTYPESIKKIELDTNVPQGLGVAIVSKVQNNSSKILSCSMYLLDDNLALIDDSCIGSNLNCASSFVGSFKTINGNEEVSCKKVISTNKELKMAVIMLDKALVSDNFEVDRSGIVKNSKLKVHNLITSINEDNVVYVKYKLKNCYARNSHYYGNFESSLSENIPVFKEGNECSLQHSDLGAIVTDEFRNFKAVLVETNLNRPLYDLEIYDVEKPKEVSLIKNISCIKLGLEKLDIARSYECSNIKKVDLGVKKQRLKNIKKHVKKLVDLEVSKILKTLPEVFKYKVQVDQIGKSSEIGLNIIPQCVVNYDLWPKEEQDKTESYGLFWLNKRYKTLIPIFKAMVKIHIDSYGMMNYQPSVENVGQMQIDVEDVSDPDSGKGAKVHLLNRAMGSTLKLNYFIKSCK